MKTIFLPISQAILIRNVLRSGGLEYFKKDGFRLVLFLPCRTVPEYLQREFQDEPVVLVPFGEIKIPRLHRWFIVFTHFLNWNKTTKRYFRYSKNYVDKARWKVIFYMLFLRLFSSIRGIKPFIRRVEERYFPEWHPVISRYFDEYQPDLVFSTSITSKLDTPFMKEAKRRGIPSVSMPKSWDNVTKMFFRFVPDYFIVQNEYMKEGLMRLQLFPADRIYVVGFPQFDWYRRPEIVRSREEHFKKLGLDPNRSLIFFGSQGAWYDKDYTVAEKVYEWVMNDEFVKPCQMFVRPHFSNVKNTPFARFKNKPRVVYDDTYRISNDFPDNWDPTTPEIIDFVNSVAHCDVMIVILSTLTLDAACLNRPVVNALFWAKYRNGKDITPFMPYTEHYSWVLETNGTLLAHNPSELKEYINQCLLNPELKKREREALRERVCYKVDGKSSERMAAAIEDIIAKEGPFLSHPPLLGEGQGEG